MKKNTPELIQSSIEGRAGVKINYLSEEIISAARKPIERMLEFSKLNYSNGG